MTTDKNITFDDIPDDVSAYELMGEKVGMDELSEGQIVVFSTNPHGDDIASVGLAKITEDLTESNKQALDEYGPYIVADIRFEDTDGNSYKFMLDNRYVTGYHSGLDRVSDIARGLGFYEVDLS